MTLSQHKSLNNSEFLQAIDYQLTKVGYKMPKVKIADIGDLYILLSEWYGLQGAVREAVGTLIISNGVEDDKDGKTWMQSDPIEFVDFLKDYVYEEPVESCGNEKMAAEVYMALVRVENFVRDNCLYVPE